MEIDAFIKNICKKTQSLHLILEKPICVNLNQKITYLVSTTLIGWGEIMNFKEIKFSEDYISK